LFVDRLDLTSEIIQRAIAGSVFCNEANNFQPMALVRFAFLLVEFQSRSAANPAAFWPP